MRQITHKLCKKVFSETEYSAFESFLRDFWLQIFNWFVPLSEHASHPDWTASYDVSPNAPVSDWLLLWGPCGTRKWRPEHWHSCAVTVTEESELHAVLWDSTTTSSRAAPTTTHSWRPCLRPCCGPGAACSGPPPSLTSCTTARSELRCGGGIWALWLLESTGCCHSPPQPHSAPQPGGAAPPPATRAWQRGCGPCTERPKDKLKVRTASKTQQHWHPPFIRIPKLQPHLYCTPTLLSQTGVLLMRCLDLPMCCGQNTCKMWCNLLQFPCKTPSVNVRPCQKFVCV